MPSDRDHIAAAVNRGEERRTHRLYLRRGEWVLLTDADLSAPIEELPVLAGAASRRRWPSVREPPNGGWWRPRNHGIETLWGAHSTSSSGLRLTGIRDTQCGFKLFPGELARALAGVQRLDGFAFDVELLLLAESWGFELNEVGVRWNHVEASRVMAVKHSKEMLLTQRACGGGGLSASSHSRPEALE